MGVVRRSAKGLRTVAAALIVAAACSSSGCVWVAAGAATGAAGYAWISNKLVKDYVHSASELNQAVKQALDELRLPVIDENTDRISGLFRAQFADGKSIRIHIEALTEYTARMTIRVGFWGDRKRSEMLMNTIEKYLPEIGAGPSSRSSR